MPSTGLTAEVDTDTTVGPLGANIVARISPSHSIPSTQKKRPEVGGENFPWPRFSETAARNNELSSFQNCVVHATELSDQRRRSLFIAKTRSSRTDRVPRFRPVPLAMKHESGESG